MKSFTRKGCKFLVSDYSKKLCQGKANISFSRSCSVINHTWMKKNGWRGKSGENFSFLQVAALAISSANGLLLKGGREASHSNKALMDLVKEALEAVGAPNAVSLVSTREEISDLLSMEGHIDLIVPRGSSELVRSIQEQSQHIPVLGHAEGVCHVYVDKDCDFAKALKIGE